MRNPFTAIRGWSSSTKKYWLVSLVMTTWILDRAEMLPEVNSISDLLTAIFAILIVTPIYLVVFAFVLGLLSDFIDWIER